MLQLIINWLVSNYSFAIKTSTASREKVKPWANTNISYKGDRENEFSPGK